MANKAKKSVWDGDLKIGLITIPIKVYNANSQNKKISFSDVHAEEVDGKECHGKLTSVGGTKTCKKCGKKNVKSIVKAYEFDKDRYIQVDSEDLDRIQIKSLDTIEIDKFVRSNEIHLPQVDTVYYLQPDGEQAKKSYALVANTLADSAYLGVGVITINGRESQCVISSIDQHGILLTTLKRKEEVRLPSDFDLSTEEVDAEEKALLHQYMESKEVSFNRLRHTDKYSEALTQILDAKVKGNKDLVVTDRKKEVTLKDHVAALAKMLPSKRSKTPVG